MGGRRRLVGTALGGVLILLFGCGDQVGEPAGVSTEKSRLVARVVDYDRGDGPVVSDGILLVDAQTGSTSPLDASDFSGGDAQFPFAASSDQVAYRCTHGACVSDATEKARAHQAQLGDAWCIAPSAEAGHVWLAELDPESPATERAINFVTEVSFGGSVRTGPSRLPSRRWHCPVGYFDGGLLFQQESGIAVWDARASKLITEIPDVFPAASHGTEVATYPDEGEARLRITDVSTGDARLIDPPAGWWFPPSYSGDYSPDGRLLAVAAGSDPTSDPNGIAVIDVSTKDVDVLRVGSVADLVWSPDGEELFATTYSSSGFGSTISVYDPQLNPLRELKLDLGILSLAAPTNE